MKKLSKRLSLILLSIILMLSLTACGGNNEEAEDVKEKETVVADETETSEDEKEEAEDDGELTEASGKLTAVEPTEDGGADLTFDTDDGELIIKMKDAGELYKLTILQNYNFNYNGKKEIIDFELSEEQDQE